MNQFLFAQWMRDQKYRVEKTESTDWAESSFGIFQAIPYHQLISPRDDETMEFLTAQKGLAVRYSTPANAPKGHTSYHVVLENRQYSIKNLQKKARYDIKYGLSVSKVEPISFGRLNTEGWKMRTSTLRRQQRLNAETQKWWQIMCETAEMIPGFEAWGTIIDNKLAACLLGFTCEDTFMILYQQSLTEYLSHRVNNTLTYVVTENIIKRPEIRQIFYGLHSLDADEGVDRFKFRMGYEAKPVRQRIVFHPLVRPFINRQSLQLVKMLKSIFPTNHIFSKAEGLFRFYLYD